MRLHRALRQRGLGPCALGRLALEALALRLAHARRPKLRPGGSLRPVLAASWRRRRLLAGLLAGLPAREWRLLEELRLVLGLLRVRVRVRVRARVRVSASACVRE